MYATSAEGDAVHPMDPHPKRVVRAGPEPAPIRSSYDDIPRSGAGIDIRASAEPPRPVASVLLSNNRVLISQ